MNYTETSVNTLQRLESSNVAKFGFLLNFARTRRCVFFPRDAGGNPTWKKLWMKPRHPSLDISRLPIHRAFLRGVGAQLILHSPLVHLSTMFQLLCRSCSSNEDGEVIPSSRV